MKKKTGIASDWAENRFQKEYVMSEEEVAEYDKAYQDSLVEEQNKKMKDKHLCHICGKPAACFGKYDNMEKEEYSCDDCCGHFDEDGHCTYLYPDERFKGEF